MLVSKKWLQEYFKEKLPEVEVLAEKLTFHAFEIEKVAGDVLDVNVLPDRAAYALSHRGIAKELSAILDTPLKKDPLTEEIPQWPSTDELVITADPEYVIRHTGALIKNITVKPSPKWLCAALESVGQRPINNIVDILNYVLLDIGQPSGAFDLSKIEKQDGKYHIDIREAKKGESITVLTGEEYRLSENIFTFTDAVGEKNIDIAGIKGGLSSGVTGNTTDIFLSVGNYDGTLLRRAAQKLKLFTDASLRYQNKLSPELTGYGMRDIVALITEIAGGELIGVVDEYPTLKEIQPVTVTKEHIEQLLGDSYSNEEIASAFTRFGFDFTQKGNVFTVTPPFERNDILIPEDIIEEIGRLYGYDRIEPLYLIADKEADQARFRGIEKIKDALVEQGFIEVSTQSFAKKGDIKLANPLDTTRPFLRTNLEDNLKNAALQAKRIAPLYGLSKPKMFEVGSVFTNAGEQMTIGTSVPAEESLTIVEDALYEPKRYTLSEYKVFSVYPFVLRDIAVWTPSGTEQSEIEATIRQYAGEYLVRIDCFDVFEKNNRVSYAFHLVFQSQERTLTDDEINIVMDKITAELSAQSGLEVR